LKETVTTIEYITEENFIELDEIDKFDTIPSEIIIS
jgi:hypothetical protein